MMNSENPEIPTFTADTDYEVPESEENRVPGWLKFTYIILPIWGIFTFYFFWHGSAGWLDRGYWRQLQTAANTVYPNKNFIEIEQHKKLVDKPEKAQPEQNNNG